MTIDPNLIDKAQTTEVHDDAFAELLAQSQAAFNRYANTLSDVEKQMVGQWMNVPPKLATWAFYRVGPKALSSSQALAHLMRQQGWVDAPRGIYLAGCEAFDGSDGANAINLCAPQDVYRRQKAIEVAALEKRSLKTALEKFDNLETELSGLGVSIDQLDIKAGESSFENVVNEGTENRARVRNKRP